MANITGTNASEPLNGTASGDVIAGLGGADSLDGGGGIDTASYAASLSGVNVSLALGTGLGGDAEGDTLVNFENLKGSAFDDTLEGNGGNNTLTGGAGNDTVSYANAGAGVTVGLAIQDGVTAQNTIGAGTDILSGFENVTGSDFNDTLTGDGLANILTGNDGNDTLNGAAGADTMLGGLGNDTYVVDNAGDVVDETGGDGTDLVKSSVTFDLSGPKAIGGIENLTLTGTLAINGTGNALDNVIIGNSVANILTGNDGNDTLDGGAGADTMRGGIGDDTYVVDNASDVVDETGGDGTDLVKSSVTFDLSGSKAIGGIENLTLTGAVAINGTGNALDNVIIGNSVANVIAGLGGADTLDGGAGNDAASYAASTSGVNVSLATGTGTGGDAEGDTLVNFENLKGSAFDDTLEGNGGNNTLTGGAGNDTVSYANAGAGVTVGLAIQDGVTAQNTIGAGTDILSGFENVTGSDFNDTLTGDGLANILTGNDGNDTLNGAAGADTMLGGLGNDTYVVDNAGDVVDETGGDGTDLVKSSVTFDLSGPKAIGGIENLTLTGTLAINGTGNALDNVIIGNSVANILTGNDGNDTLDGGAGADTMRGGIGDDTYVVDNASDVVDETGGDGTDLVKSSVTFDLSGSKAIGGIENLTLTGAVAINGTGNALDNVIIGNSVANVIAGLGGADTLDGGAGNDAASYAASTSGVNVSLATGTGTGGDAEGDTLVNFENLKGSAFDDTLEGNGGNNTLTGGAGNDTVSYANAGAGVTVGLAIQDGVTAQNTIGAGTDILSGFENVTGSDFNDTLTGDGLANILTGNDGNDTLNGAAGADTMLGGLGNDTYVVDNAGDVVDETGGDGTDLVKSSVTFDLSGPKAIGGIENLTLTGTLAINGTGNALDNVIIGNSVANILTGNDGNDTLDGGAGADTMRGGIGDDTYVVDNASDVVDETGGDGTDLVKSSVTFDLSGSKAIGGIENLTLTGAVAINGTGNALDNVIIGNSVANVIAGLGGADTLDGGAGNDAASYAASTSGVNVSLATGTGTGGDAEGDTLVNFENLKGSAFDDTLEGNGGNNTLTGGAGNDTVSYANAGAGVTVGLAIQDGVTAQNTIGAGTDILSGFENVTGSDFNDTLTGDGLANILTGNDGNDTLNGAAGADTMLGGLGNDTYVVDNAGDVVDETGGDGTDLVKSSVTFDLSGPKAIGGIENLTLTGTLAINGTGNALDNVIIGNSVANILTGNDGNDTLDGGAGADTMRGGIGDDTYVVDNASDVVDETGGDGTDLVKSSVTFDLSGSKAIGGIENLTLTGAVAINGTGNALDNVIIGNSVANVIAGLGGADTLDGGAGNDAASYAASTSGVNVSLATGTGTGGDAEGDTLVNFENLKGSAFDDTLEGNGGNNTLTGGAGNDTVSYANAGAGVTVGLAIQDGVTAQNTIGAGTDILSGFENVTGSDFNDTLAGDNNDNILDGGAGVDTVSYAGALSGVTISLAAGTASGAGSDTLLNFENVIGSGLNDTIEGDDGDNVLSGGAGTDILSYGNASAGVAVNLGSTLLQDTVGAGKDTVSGFENLTGSAFDDVLEGSSGSNTLIGGAGNDTVSYAHSAAGVTVDLSKAVAQNTVGAGTDTLVGFENLIGSSFNDTLSGDANDNVLDGGAGNDTLSYATAVSGVTVTLSLSGPQATGQGNDDISNFENLKGSAFDDTLEGNSGSNTLTGGAGNDTLSYANAGAGVTVGLTIQDGVTAQNTIGAGTDILSGFENVTGSDFNDTLTGDGAANILIGNDGNDALDGGVGADQMQGGLGNDTYVVDNAGDVVDETGGDGTDLVKSSVTFDLSGTKAIGGIENLTLTGTLAINGTGNALDNIIVGNSAANVIAGLGGADTLDGGGGIDTASYAASGSGVNVSLALGTGTGGDAEGDTLVNFENLTGSAFVDTLKGSSGDNTLLGGAGNDTLDGRAGNDTLTGGIGGDKYIYADAYGADTITDFNRVEGDVIDVSGVTGVFSFADIQSKAVASGANTLITFSAGNTLTLTGVSVASLQATDFIFAASINGTAGSDNGFDNGVNPVIPVVTGTSNSEAIYGLAGNDIIEGLGGNDYIDGGTGRDVADYHQATGGITVDMANGTVTGDASVGSDVLRSIEGVRGTDFADTYAATGFGPTSKNNSLDIEIQSSISNTFEGGDGDDKITANALTQAAFDAGLRGTQASYAHAAAAVTVDLGAGTATSTAGGDAAQIGSDTLINVAGVVGSDFNDTLIGRNDSVNDQFGFVDVFFGGKGNDLIDGKGGYDFVAYSSLGNPSSITAGVTVNMAAGTVTGDASIGTDTLRSIESVRGTQFNDVYDATGFGSGSTNAGSGGGFNSFEGMAGDDTITGNGSTRVDYNYATASVTVDLAAGTGHSTVADNALVGNDTFTGADVFGMKHGINSVRGSSYDDFLFGSNNTSGTEFFANSRGNDTIDGRGGFDRAQYWSAGSDTVTAGIAIDMAAGTVKGDASVGNDTLNAIEAIQGTRFADTYTAFGFSGSSANAGSLGTFNEFQGMGGNDSITGNGNTRIAFYNALDGVTVDLAAGTAKGTAAGDKADVGTDALKGGINAVTGSDFADTLLGSATGSNAEIFEGRAGNDAINGRGGYDLAIYNNDGSVTTGIAVTVTATTMTVTGDARVGIDTLTAVESVRGTNLVDTYNAAGFNGASIDFGPTSTFNEFEGMAGNDTITGNGNTRISYISSTGGVTVNLIAGTATGNGSVGTDTITGGVNSVRGSNSADTIIGNSGANVIDGLAGNDTLDGRAGNDTLTGGIGGDKYIYADAYGADTITDFNRVEGDVIDVSGVTGVFSFADIQSKAVASGANTLITFSAGNTLTLTGVSVASLQATDFIFAASINGTAGSDNGFDNGVNPVIPVVTGTSNSEAIYGLAGNDIIEGLGGNDYIDGGTGRDVADYHQATGGITVDMANGTVTGDASVGSDVLRSIEGVRGTDFADTYAATGFGPTSKNNSLDIEIQSSISNTFEGGDGDDKITANALTQAAFDAGLRGTQASYAHAAAAVTVDLGAGTATSTAGGDAAQIGSDTLINVAGVVGSDFNDTLIGRNDSVNDQFGFVDVFFGGKGNDLIDGKGGYDFVAYSSLGNPSSITAGVTVNMAAGTVTGDASIGTDTLRSIESVRGTQFNDVYDATGFGSGSTNAGSGGGFNSFEGMAGDDTITGNGSTRVDYNYATASVTVDLAAGTGHSTVADNALVGNDTFTGADVFGMKHGINSVRGSSYDDFLFGSNNTSGTEFFANSRGNDTIDGRGGFDRAQYWSAGSDTVTAGIAIDMAAGTVKGDASVGNDTLNAIEAIQGTRFADTYTAFGFSGSSANAGSLGTFNEFQGMGGNDSITGNGNTRIAFYNALDGVTVDLAAGTAKGTAAGDKADVGTDALKGGINAVTGSDFADTLLGSATGSNAEIFEGRAGNDAINGRGGYDLAIYNNDGSVTTGIAVTVTATTMTVTGDARVGIDTLTAVESVRGTNLVDTYNAAGFNGASIDFGPTSTFNEFEGMAGNDTITGNGNTRISYISSTGGVTVNLIAGTATGNGSVGTDTITGGVNSVRGSNSADTIIGNSGANVIDGRQGADTLTGNAGNDTFVFNSFQASGDIVTDFAGNGANPGDQFQLNGFGTAAQGATFTFIGTVNGGVDSTWQIHSGLDGHNELITLQGINSAAGIHSTDYLLL